MSTLEIQKVKLHKTKNGNGLEMSYERTGPQGDKVAVVGEIHTALVHNDFYNAIQALAPHLAMMAFHVKESEVEDIAMPDPAKFKDFSVGSYSINGKDEKRGIIISGTLRKSGKAHNFNTPFYRFEEPESGRYGFMDDVEAILSVIESEVKPYLDGTKRGEAIQPELPLEDSKLTKIQMLPEEKVVAEAIINKANGKVGKSNGTPKKVKQTAENPSGIVNE